MSLIITPYNNTSSGHITHSFDSVFNLTAPYRQLTAPPTSTLKGAAVSK
jgi:hypothetical protein